MKVNGKEVKLTCVIIQGDDYRFEKELHPSQWREPIYRILRKAVQRGLIEWCDHYWFRGTQQK